jgi:expansin (peptidoglycan-binding protein)
MNHIDYDSAAACGTWVHIFGPKGDVIAFINDECPECLEGDIDLGPNTFEVIAERHVGRAPITWRYIQAPVQGPVEYFWKDGTSRYHLELQVRNHRYGITKLEIQTQTSEWVTVKRFPYNYFKKYGGIDNQPGPYNIRITDIFGNQLTDTMIHIVPGESIEGNANFPVISDPIQKSKNLLSHKYNYYGPRIYLAINRKVRIQHTSTSLIIYSILGRKIGTAKINRFGVITLPKNCTHNSIVIITDEKKEK